MKSMGTPTATKNRLLTSHTKDPSNHFNHLIEGSFASSRLWRYTIVQRGVRIARGRMTGKCTANVQFDHDARLFAKVAMT